MSEQIALFPIPVAVSFPGTTFALHVFEPRYRQMIDHAIKQKIKVGVCHTEKLIHEPKTIQQSLDEALHSNQATYKPCSVFSAGFCEIKETLSDGRLMIEVKLDQRYEKLRDIQTLPFTISECTPLLDDPVLDLQHAKALQNEVLRHLTGMLNSMPMAKAMLENKPVVNKPPEAFSFEIFELIKLPTEQLQAVLEMTSANKRLQYLLDYMHQGNH
jgi:Lon protease-like protein